MKKIRLGIYDLGLGGGATRYLNDLLAAIPRDRFELVFFPEGTQTAKSANTGSNAGLTFEQAQLVLPPKSLAARLWRKLPEAFRLGIGMLRETWALRQQFKRRPVDILHTNYAGFEESSVAARLAGIKVVIGTYNVLPSPEYITAPGLQKFGEWLGGKCLDVAIAGAHEIGVAWTARTAALQGRFIDIPWGIDVAKVERNAAQPYSRNDFSLPESSPILAVSARLHAMKGITFLLQALPAILQQFPTTILLLIGDGPERAALERQAAALKLGDHVRFLGWREDSLRIIPLCDIVVLSSIFLETWGSALAEAMVLRKPIVATRIGGVPELVADGETGLIVPPRDPAALADAISQFLRNPALARQFGDAGRRRVETIFPIAKMQQATIELYERTWRTRTGQP